MAFIIVIVFTWLLISCHPFNLKILYFTLNSFRLFVSSLLTMVQIYTYTVTCTSAGVFTLTQSNSTGTAGTLRLKLYVI